MLSCTLLDNVYVSTLFTAFAYVIYTVGIVSLVAGSTTSGYLDGVGSAAKFYKPSGLSVDSMGNIWVADFGNHMIRKISSTGDLVVF